jgi:hypothetical protein
MAHRQNVGVRAECVEHRVEQRAREHRRTQIADALGIDRVMRSAILGIAADGDGQLVAQPLANLGARFARYGEQFRLVVGGKIAREIAMRGGGCGPVLRCLSAAQFDRVCAAPQREFLGRATQRLALVLRHCQRPAADRKAARHQRPPEQRRMHIAEREPAGQPARAGCDQAQRLLPGTALDRRQPCRTVEHRTSLLGHETLDPRDLVGVVQIGERHACGRGGAEILRQRIHGANSTQRCASILASSSIRPQRKSPASRRSLSAIPERLV